MYWKLSCETKTLVKQSLAVTCGFPLGLSLNWTSIGLGYEVFSLPPSCNQAKLPGLTPVPPHLSHTRCTHIPLLTLLSSGCEMDSYCLPECTTYLWMGFSFALFSFSFPVPHVRPFCFPAPPTHCTTHIPRRLLWKNKIRNPIGANILYDNLN